MTQELIREVIRLYFEDPVYELVSDPSGLTNLTRIVAVNGEKYVVRIYDRHTKQKQGIELEAEVSAFLNKSGLSFGVPEFRTTLSGMKYIQLSDGRLGVMMNYLEGMAPELTSINQAAEYGRVVGEMSAALGICPIVRSTSYRGKPFTDIYGFHPLADRHAVTAFLECPPFPVPEESLHFYQEMIAQMECSLPSLAKLPSQLVHHDVLAFNLLAQGSKITGILDFDFISYDAGCMELAICLNHILQMSKGSFEMAGAFLQGYAKYRKFSLQEFGTLQLLTQIYHVTLLHFYIGQHYSGKSIEQIFLYILNQFVDRNRWLTQHSLALKRMLNIDL